MTNPKTLAQWVATQRPPGVEHFDCTLIAGDASPRQYYRVVWHPSTAKNSTAIAVIAPASEKNTEFLWVRQLLDNHSVKVPALLAHDLEQGFLLLEDLGDMLLAQGLVSDAADTLYGTASAVLQRLACIPLADSQLPAYDHQLLMTELHLFPQWFLGQLLKAPADARELALFDDLAHVLLANADEQPRVVVHRDFHCRNLLLAPGHQLSVIDFQDAVIGPITYDPVSLMKDCYLQCPRTYQVDWLLTHKNKLEAKTAIPTARDEQWLQWFDLMGLQRHIKVLGIFARLALRDTKPDYLAHLPTVVGYVQEALQLYAPSISPIAAFADWFESCVIPRCKDQHWFNGPAAPTAKLSTQR